MPELSRREFIIAGTGGLLYAALATEEAFGAPNRLTDAEINRRMALPTVEDVLRTNQQAGNLTYVTVNRDGSTDYDEVVYQHSATGAKRPVLVLFYGSAVLANKRVAIIFDELINTFGNQIKFAAHNSSSDNHRLSRQENIQGVPSIAMYSLFDLVLGETRDRNNGRIKQIDVLQSGPTDNRYINQWIDYLSSEWISLNITRPNGRFVKRFENRADGNDREITYSSS